MTAPRPATPPRPATRHYTVPSDPPPRPSDRWIPRAIVGFFLVLGTVQAGFVTLAYDSFTGLVTDDPYATGIEYDRVLKERETEAALGWQVEALFEPGSEPRTGRLMVRVTDAGGQPLDDVILQGEAEHTGRIPQLLPVSFTPAGPDRLVGTLDFPNGGNWFIRLKVTQGDEGVRRLVELPVIR